jgi:hypothetical protein
MACEELFYPEPPAVCIRYDAHNIDVHIDDFWNVTRSKIIDSAKTGPRDIKPARSECPAKVNARRQRAPLTHDGRDRRRRLTCTNIAVPIT